MSALKTVKVYRDINSDGQKSEWRFTTEDINAHDYREVYTLIDWAALEKDNSFQNGYKIGRRDGIEFAVNFLNSRAATLFVAKEDETARLIRKVAEDLKRFDTQ